MQMFFIVGCPRSGTTLLQQALNRHPRVAIPPETAFFIDLLGHTRRGQEAHLRRLRADLGIDLPPLARRVPVGPAAVALYGDIARRYVARLGRPGVTHFGDKSPHHLLRIRRILRLLPEAPVILLARDGRDVALSLSRVPWSPDDLYVNFAIWLRYARRQRRLLESPAGRRVLALRYEDLAARPREELGRVASFLGLPDEPAMASGAGNREGVPDRELAWKGRALAPIDGDRAGAWRREMATGERAILEAWGGAELAALGYELAGEAPARTPWWLPWRVLARHTAWRAGAAVRLARKELGAG